MIERRRPWVLALAILLHGLAGLLGCSSMPELDGRKANTFTPEELQAAGRKLLEEKRYTESADLLEYVIRTKFDYAQLEEVYFLAAEARFGEATYDQSFIHYRRLMDQYPYTRHAPTVGRRVWKIGKTLVDQPGRWFGDLSTRSDQGVEALNFLVTRFPRSSDADDAWKELAEAFARDHQWQAVVDIYERLMREYPDSEWADLACYKVTAAYRAQSRGFEFDVDPLLRSHAALRRYLRRFPDGNFVVQAEEDLRRLEDEVVLHEMEIARYYREVGVPQGERIHMSNAASRFPGSEEAKGLDLEQAGEGEGSLDLLQPRTERPPWRRTRSGSL